MPTRPDDPTQPLPEVAAHDTAWWMPSAPATTSSPGAPVPPVR
jgi:hypothetical protein